MLSSGFVTVVTVGGFELATHTSTGLTLTILIMTEVRSLTRMREGSQAGSMELDLRGTIIVVSPGFA
jgi:hypothetical protein